MVPGHRSLHAQALYLWALLRRFKLTFQLDAYQTLRSRMERAA
jgi:hypothetical protein